MTEHKSYQRFKGSLLKVVTCWGGGGGRDLIHCVVFLGKTRNFHTASLRKGYNWVSAK